MTPLSIIGFAGLALALTLGAGLTRLIPLQWHRAEWLAASIVAGLLVSLNALLLLIWVLGYLPGTILFFILAGTGSWLLFTKTKPLKFHKDFLPDRTTLIIWLTLTILTTLILTPILVNHMLYLEDGNFVSGGGAWGDLALHTSLLTRFAYQDAFTWDFPLTVDAPLTYPFLIDFASGLLHRSSFSLQLALVVPSLLFIYSFMQLLFFASLRLFNNALAAALVIPLFLSNGGPAGLQYFWQDFQASGLSLFNFLLQMEVEYAHLADFNIRFSNIVADYLIPQRGILIGLPVFALLIILWHAAWSKPERTKQLLPAAAILTGLLPLAHVHTFFVACGLWVWLTAAHYLINKRINSWWVKSLPIIALFAALPLGWQLSHSFSSEFSGLHYGWMKGENETLLIFWLRNIGLATIFLFANFFAIARLPKHRQFIMHFYTALIVLFLITNLYLFQPHAYDNMKFMLYSYLAIMLVAALMLAQWLQHKNWGLKLLSLVCIISLTLTGAISILRESYTKWPLNTASDILAAEVVKRTLPTNARILVAPRHNHFIPMLTGRRIVLGYPGWLWTHGIDYRSIETDIRLIYAGHPTTPELISHYNITHIAVGTPEKQSFEVNQRYFLDNYPVAVTAQDYLIFSTK